MKRDAEFHQRMDHARWMSHNEDILARSWLRRHVATGLALLALLAVVLVVAQLVINAAHD